VEAFTRQQNATVPLTPCHSPLNRQDGLSYPTSLLAGARNGE
jgi:hypothetical protein